MFIQEVTCGDKVRIRNTDKRGVINEIRLTTREVLIDTGNERIVKHIDDLVPIAIESEDTLRELLRPFVMKEFKLRGDDCKEGDYFILNNSYHLQYDCLYVNTYNRLYSYPSVTLCKGIAYFDIIRSRVDITKIDPAIYDIVSIDRFMSISFEYQLNRLLTLLYN